MQPASRRLGQFEEQLSKWLEEAAKARHPERWSGATRNWQQVLVVHLNPEKPATEVVMKQEKNPELKKAA
ncbi:MAG: hypothetical protein HHJ09_15505 [Glaciimonas sp.]|nr:hypothetical protein [Glaciimonas sp.]